MAAIEQNIIFPIKSEDGNPYHDLVLHKATVDSVVMSLGDKITGDVYYNGELTDITMKEYVEYEGVKYILINPPTKVREGMVSDNSDLRGMTKYSFEFYHPMCKLGNMPFTDVAVSEDEKRYLSESNTFFWIGTCYDYIDKLNKNLENTEWVVVASGNEESEAKMEVLSDVLSFDKKTIAEALKTMYDTWEVPFVIDQLTSGTYYNQGKKFSIVVGLPSNEILVGGNPFVFHFGQGVGLKNNSRTPRNNKIVTRIAGYGSEHNIPYGYPQIRWYGASGREFTYGDHAGTYNNVVIGGHTFAKVVSYPIYKGILGGAYVDLIKHPFTRNVLMPSIYRERLFNKISLYNANGSVNTSYNPDIELIDYYDADDNTFVNQINLLSPSYEIHGFDKIKPRLGENSSLVSVIPYNDTDYGEYYTFTEFTNRINIYKELAVCTEEVYALTTLYDSVADGTKKSDSDTRPESQQHNWYGYKWEYKTDDDFYYIDFASSHFNFTFKVLKEGHQAGEAEWDDTMDDNGEYKQSYFKVTLPQLAFDMYACAAITEEMEINMRSGACIGCTFPIQIDWEDYKKNFYNSDGEFDPVPHTTTNDGHVRDASKYPLTNAGQVTVILQKETSTFGTLMPNIYQQPHAGDKFVILGISLPSEYITNAEEELDEAMVEYMRENNIYYYDYPLKFDEYFLATHTDILEQIHNNTIVRFGDNMALYVKQITIKYGDAVLPQYDITLTDDVEVVLNQIGQVTDDVSRMRVQLNDLQKYYGENIITELANKLSRTADDVAMGRITFQQGLTSIGNAIFGSSLSSSGFVSGDAGRGWQIDQFGNAELESVRIRSFLQVQELLINRLQAQEGDTLFTDNDQIIDVELEQGGTYKLTLKEKWDGYYTAQQEGNIVKGIINTLAAKDAGVSDESDNDPEDQGSDDGGNKYYTSWMRVVATQSTAGSGLKKNQIRVILYGDEDTPAQKNFAPCNLMNIARWGCTLNPNEAGISEGERQSRIRRQQMFLISSSDGRITKLSHVNTPKLRETNYGTTLGTLPEFIRNWSIASRLIDGRDYLYAQGVVVGDFVKVDIQGDPIVQYVDCGEWVDGQTYLVNEHNDETLQWETHDVWHNGAKWRCMQHQPVVSGGTTTYYEPEDGSEYWNKIESMPALAVLEMDTNVVVVETDSDGYVTTAVNKSVGIRILLGNDILSATNIEITEDGSVNYVILDDPTIYSTDENDYVDAEVEYLDGGASVVAETLYLDGRYYLVIHGVRVVVQRGALLDKHNATLDITCEDSSGKSYSLRGTLQIAGVSDGVDGTSTPAYFDEWFAWSNVESTADVYTSPFVEPYVGWSLSIPNNNGLAYLWRKQIRHEYNAASHTYTTENAQYVRMNGTNGTSIHTRGQVASANKRGAGTAYILVEGGSEERITLSDGDAVTQLDNGHLYQWVTEGGGQWLDLGQFKGEAGVTYYTHVAWATDVTYSGSTITSVSGFIITKSADDTTHHWMGVLVDTNSGQDPANATLYTWSYIKGENGVNAIHLTIDNEHEDFIYSAGEKVAPTSVTIQAHLYDGNSEIDATDVRWTINLSKTTGIDLSLLTNDYGRYTLSGINANTAKLCIQATYPIVGGRTYEAIFTSNRTSQDKYDIIASPSSIAYNPASYQTQTITLSAVKTNLAGVQSYATISTMSGNPSAGDLRVLYAWVNSDGTKTTFTRLAATSIGITAENCRDYVGIYFELHLFTSSTNSVVKDYETVEFAKSENGTDGVGGLAIGVTPSNIFVNTDASGKAEASSQDIRVEVFEGDTKVPVAQYTISHGTLPSGITWTGRYHDAFTIAVAANTMLTTPVVIPFTVALSSGGSINSSIIVIPNKRGVDGSAYYLDLTNENDSLQYMGDENLTGTITSQAILYNGNTPVQSDVTFSRDASSTITAGYCTVNGTTGAITVTGLPDGVLSGVLVIKATYNNSEDYYKTFSVQRIDNGEPKYELLIDKASVVQNTSESTSSQTVNVKVFKTAIDTTSKKLVKRQLTTLLTDHLRLYAVPSAGATGDMTRNYGLDGLNYQASALNITSVTFYVTNDYEWGHYNLITYDYEGIPVVAVQNGQNGQNGQTGKMGRTPYYWGKWSEKGSTDVFSVTDYMTPYVAHGGNGSVPQCWIFIGANGNYTKAIAGDPSNINDKWQLMTTDFEYLITKAIFSDFAKLGSAIFNGDYMFSQHGTDENGGISYDYEYFDPTGVTNRFTPNVRMNWLTGEIYSQLGHFVNVTVEGVLNNLVQVITDDNYQNYGTYNSNWSDESEVYGATFFLNPLKVDGFVKIVKSCNIHFPSACRCLDGGNDNYIDKIFDGEDSGNHLTYEEMRQCIGKKIILLPNMPQDGASWQSQYRFMCGGTNAGYANKLLVTKSILFPVSDAGTMSSDLTAIATDGAVSEPTISYSRYMYIHPNYGTNTRFYVFECKLGHYNTKECIYWEMQEIGSILNAQ